METLYIADKSVAELEQLFACKVDDDDYYDVIAYNLAQIDPEYLPKHVASYEGIRLRGAVFGLGCSPERNEQQRQLLASFLGHADPLIVAEAIDALQNSEYTDCWKPVSALQNHDSPYVRGAVLRYARFALPPEHAFALLVSALGEADPIVLQNALDELGESGNPAARKHVFPFLNSDDEDVQLAARSAFDALGVDRS